MAERRAVLVRVVSAGMLVLAVPAVAQTAADADTLLTSRGELGPCRSNGNDATS